MLKEQVSSLHDPLNCNWITEFKVETIPPPIWGKGATKFLLSAQYSLTVTHPSGTITFGSTNSLIDTISWGEEQEIAANAASNTVFQHLVEDDLNKIWWIRLSFEGESIVYQRYVYYSSSNVYPGNSIDDTSEIFPEQNHSEYKNRINTGVCFSGGGTRALVMGMGQMRYLQQFQDKIGYFSSVSGGSWASSVYAYSNENSPEELLGTAVDPDEYEHQLGATKPPKMSFGAQKGWFTLWTMVNIFRMVPYFMYQYKQRIELDPNLRNDFQKVFDSLVELDKEHNIDLKITPNRFWIDTIGLSFFLSNGMYSLIDPTQELFTLDVSSREGILNESGSLKEIISNSTFKVVNTTNGYPPYLIMNSLMLRPEERSVRNFWNKLEHIGYEYTPLYQGAAFNAKSTLKKQFIGGGNAAMHTYGTKVVANTDGNKVLVMYQSSNPLASLAVASGTSSSAFAGTTGTIGDDIPLFLGNLADLAISAWEYFFKTDKEGFSNLNLTEIAQGNVKLESWLSDVWPQIRDGFPVVIDFLKTFSTGILSAAPTLTPESNYFSPKKIAKGTKNVDWLFGDAGLSDNLGLMAMLRRKVKNIIVFINTGEALEFDNINGSSELKSITEEIPAFFNKQEKVEESKSGINLEGMQVFSENDYEMLITQWKECLDKDQPLIADTTMTVIENEKWTVPGAWETRVLWVYNSMPDSWNNSLPDSVKEITSQRNFPYINTFGSTIYGMTIDQITMLSNLSYWTSKEAESTIKEMLNA